MRLRWGGLGGGGVVGLGIVRDLVCVGGGGGREGGL